MYNFHIVIRPKPSLNFHPMYLRNIIPSFTEEKHIIHLTLDAVNHVLNMIALQVLQVYVPTWACFLSRVCAGYR